MFFLGFLELFFFRFLKTKKNLGLFFWFLDRSLQKCKDRSWKGILRKYRSWAGGGGTIYIYGCFQNLDTPKWMVYNGNPIKMDDLGVPLFLETSICTYINIFFPRYISHFPFPMDRGCLELKARMPDCTFGCSGSGNW